MLYQWEDRFFYFLHLWGTSEIQDRGWAQLHMVLYINARNLKKITMIVTVR